MVSFFSYTLLCNQFQIKSFQIVMRETFLLKTWTYEALTTTEQYSFGCQGINYKFTCWIF